MRTMRTMRVRPRGSFRRGKSLRIAAIFGALLWLGALSLAPAGEQFQWTFADDSPGGPPRGWEVLSGQWEVRIDEDGQNRILVQTGPSLPGFDLPTILAPAPSVRDVRARVKLKPAGAGAFETMGVILRWQDPGTMTIVRVDGTPGRIWLDRLQDGHRSLRAGYIVPLLPDRWNLLRVVAQGDWLNLFLNGEFLGGVREDDPLPGRVGLMAGPGARVLLDDFVLGPPGISGPSS